MSDSTYPHCRRHPWQPAAGVCGACLNERLAKVAEICYDRNLPPVHMMENAATKRGVSSIACLIEQDLAPAASSQATDKEKAMKEGKLSRSVSMGNSINPNTARVARHSVHLRKPAEDLASAHLTKSRSVGACFHHTTTASRSRTWRTSPFWEKVRMPSNSSSSFGGSFFKPTFSSLFQRANTSNLLGRVTSPLRKLHACASRPSPMVDRYSNSRDQFADAGTTCSSRASYSSSSSTNSSYSSANSSRRKWRSRPPNANAPSNVVPVIS